MQTEETRIAVRLPKTLRAKIIKHMERARKKEPMYNLSDAIRDLLEKATSA